MTGDIILDESIFAYNAGFNSIMQKRILDSIPQWKDSIGIVDTSWIEIDYESMLEFIGLFDYELLTDTSVLVTIIHSRIENSQFKNLMGLKIKDDRTGNWFDMNSLSKGAVFEVKGPESYRGYMELDFNECKSPEYICTTRYHKNRVPFSVGPY